VALLAGIVGAFEFGKRWAERLEKKEQFDAQEKLEAFRQGADAAADLGKFRGQLLKRVADLEDECSELRIELRESNAEMSRGLRAYNELERTCSLLRIQNDALTMRLQYLEARVQVTEDKQGE
jgi:hypothetical protein